MKGILIDENLPNGLVLPTDLDINHVSTLGKSPTDSDIWFHALKFDLVIVTKDADFSHRIIAANPPPRVVHIRFGNMKLRRLVSLLVNIWPQIESHLSGSKLVNVYEHRIETVT